MEGRPLGVQHTHRHRHRQTDRHGRRTGGSPLVQPSLSFRLSALVNRPSAYTRIHSLRMPCSLTA